MDGTRKTFSEWLNYVSLTQLAQKNNEIIFSENEFVAVVGFEKLTDGVINQVFQSFGIDSRFVTVISYDDAQKKALKMLRNPNCKGMIVAFAPHKIKGTSGGLIELDGTEQKIVISRNNKRKLSSAKKSLIDAFEILKSRWSTKLT